MERREFVSSALLASVLATAPALDAAATDANENPGGREYYQLRRYQLSSAQVASAADYFANALIPALNRMQIAPVGIFNVSIGMVTPAPYVLMPSESVERLINLDQRLADDAEYQRAGKPFLTAAATEPSFSRIDSTLLQAFAKAPRLVLPAAAIARTARIYELRSYENPSERDHLLKMEQMQAGEVEIFKSVGAWPVFFSNALIGPRLPKITYMLGFENLAARERIWAAFSASASWKALNSDPRYAFESIVSNITNEILTPTAYSQI